MRLSDSSVRSSVSHSLISVMSAASLSISLTVPWFPMRQWNIANLSVTNVNCVSLVTNISPIYSDWLMFLSFLNERDMPGSGMWHSKVSLSIRYFWSSIVESAANNSSVFQLWFEVAIASVDRFPSFGNSAFHVLVNGLL